MKRVSILLAFLVFSALLSISQNNKHISLSFNLNDFKIQQDIDGSCIICSDLYDLCLKEDTLLPALPYIGYNVLVRGSEKYVSHTSSSTKLLIRSDVTMAHNPEVIPTNVQPSLHLTGSLSSYSFKYYPDTDVEFAGNNECGSYSLLTFHVCPFEYDATTRKLFLKNHVDIDINLTDNAPISFTDFGRRSTIAMDNVIKKMVVNPEDLDMTTREVAYNNNLTLQTGYEYLIVTSNQFKNVFQQLANWKSRKGIRSKVLTVEEIIPNYTGLTRQEKIKRAIADIDGLTYVLLGGDTLNVPTCMCYIKSKNGSDSITPADSYYSCLGTMNWDGNGNGLYADTCDAVSLIPYLNVSRAPVSTIGDAQVFVNRIINYESNPDTTNWKKSILMSGSSLGFKDNGIWYPFYDLATGKSDTQIWSEMIYNDSIAPPNLNLPRWDGDSTRFYDTYTDISGDGTYYFNETNLQNELIKGYTFVDVMTHGGQNSWQMEGSNPTHYSYNHARNLVNSGYTIITTTACFTNAFDYSSNISKCLSQEFVNNAQSGILAYWGTSRENWYTVKSLSVLGNGSKFDGLTYRKLFEDKYHRMGKATTEVKRAKMSSAVNSYNTTRKIWMSLNLMGDPEMPVYLSKPKYFQNADIQFVNDSIYVDSGEDDYDICFVNQSDPTDYYTARDIETSSAVFGRKNGAFDACITKPGYIPITMVCDKTYLQNRTLTGSKTYATSNVMIGSDVTNIVSQGSVTINSGSTIVKASEGVTITKDFEVKNGAEFMITIE